MKLDDVGAVLDVLRAREIVPLVGGGWGVDALVGTQTREHRDLDLAVDAERLDEVLALLAGLGYRPQTDWLPVRLELAAPGDRYVDLHPVVYDRAGDGVQAGPDGTTFGYPAADRALGFLGGRPVACLSVARQRVFHSGYDPRPHDVADLARLAEVDARTESALLLEVPAAEPLVHRHRNRFDPAAGDGVPAHVTVLYPFAPPADLDRETFDRLAAEVARHRPFDLVLDRTDWFGELVLWLGPDDPAAVVDLTADLLAVFPQFPLYDGAYDVITPHLTVGQGAPVAELRAVERTLREGLPIRQRVTELGLWVGAPTTADGPGGFVRLTALPLAGRSS